MNEITGFFEAGRLDVVIFIGLLGALLWTVKQWRDAEKGRIEDLRTMVTLATEVKNSVATLVELVKGERGSR